MKLRFLVQIHGEWSVHPSMKAFGQKDWAEHVKHESFNRDCYVLGTILCVAFTTCVVGSNRLFRIDCRMRSLLG